ncbi:MAG: tail fiber protein [Verrucomicrobia bacterium]|nr:tail fiber protein [Verrucomicrobiota bacterium]
MNTLAKKPYLILFLIALACIIPPFLSKGDVPRVMTFQGKLTDPQGHVLDGNHKLTFRIYNQETGGGVLWQEVHNATPVTKGIFAVPLGASTPLNLPFDTAYWVSIEVGTDGEMSPRQRLTSAPYAIRAGQATQADTATHATTADSLTTPLTLPTGTVLTFAGVNVPNGFLLCDGSSLSSLTYPELFTVLGSSWGIGDGTLDTQGHTKDFRLPDLRGRMPAGRDGSQSEFNAIGKTGGAKTHTLVDAEIPSHYHFVLRNEGSGAEVSSSNALAMHTTRGGDEAAYLSGIASPANAGRSSSVGGGQPHNNLPPFGVVNYIIKY